MITAADIDAASRANLRVRFRLGEFDPASRVPYKSIAATETPWTGATHKARALDVARKTVVLLKNAVEHAAAGQDRLFDHRRRRPARRHRAA